MFLGQRACLPDSSVHLGRGGPHPSVYRAGGTKRSPVDISFIHLSEETLGHCERQCLVYEHNTVTLTKAPSLAA